MSLNHSQVVILLGRSGCGKGTQAKLLKKKFGFAHISGGELFRRKAKEDDFTGRKLKKQLKKGVLAPTFLALRLWSEEAEKLADKKNLKGLILDGNPRALLEAKILDTIFAWYEWKKIRAILVDISEKEAYDRLTKRRMCSKCGQIIPWLGEFKKLKKCNKCGGALETRSDDSKEAIKSRMNYYNSDVKKVVEYYEKKGALKKVNGEQSIEDVHKAIVAALG